MEGLQWHSFNVVAPQIVPLKGEEKKNRILLLECSFRIRISLLLPPPILQTFRKQDRIAQKLTTWVRAECLSIEVGTLSDDCARGSKSSKKVARRRVPLLWCDSYPDLAIWVFWRTWKKLAGLAWCRSPLGKWCSQCPWGAEKTRLLTQRFRSCKHHQFLPR